MTLFDLVFLVAALTAIVTLARILVALVRGRGERAVALVKEFALVAAVYLSLSVVVSFTARPRQIRTGEPWCFDDWCLTLDRVSVAPRSDGSVLETDLHISSTARRVSQHANGAWIYLVDSDGNRYPPSLVASDVPLTAELRPGESIAAKRRFLLPRGIRAVGLITGHGGPYCGPMQFLVIGQASCAFGRPQMIHLAG